MIEQHFRKFHPDFDVTRILTIRTSSEPLVRDAILWEYSLDPLLPFAIDPDVIDDEIGDFLRLRGTLTSIRMALRWVGFPSISFTPLSFYEYEIDPGRVPSDRELLAIRAALSVSTQARGILKRIYHGEFEVKYG